eukprot:2295108-Pleurochrysis_carterae.AAC.4
MTDWLWPRPRVLLCVQPTWLRWHACVRSRSMSRRHDWTPCARQSRTRLERCLFLLPPRIHTPAPARSFESYPSSRRGTCAHAHECAYSFAVAHLHRVHKYPDPRVALAAQSRIAGVDIERNPKWTSERDGHTRHFIDVDEVAATPKRPCVVRHYISTCLSIREGRQCSRRKMDHVEEQVESHIASR